MPHTPFPLASRSVCVIVGLGVASAAYLRGAHLLGVRYGVVSAAIAGALIWLLARTRTPTGHFSLARTGVVAAFALLVVAVMTFPASVNSRLQYFIADQATERQARAELAALIASEPTFRELSVATTHAKVVNVTIQGRLPNRTALDQLRSRIVRECPSRKTCLMQIKVLLRDSGAKAIEEIRDERDS